MSCNRNIITLLLVTLLLIVAITPTAAQTTTNNLLENPDFNGAGNYRDQRPAGSTYPFAFAPGWGGWQTLSPRTASWMNIEPIAFPHTASRKYDKGDASQNIGRGSGTFTAAAHQTVNNIAEGTTLRFSVWVFQENAEGKGAQTRVGIGSNTGGNPLAPAITWSNWSTAVMSWQQISVDATVPAGSVTVFIYSTQSQPNDPNQVYYDVASLVNVGTGTVNVGSGGANVLGTPNATPLPPATPTPAFVPFVNPQSASDSGRIEHVVQSGDTLAAIAVAYGVPLSEILEINSLERGAFLSLGQTILIQEESEQPTIAPATATTESAAAAGDAPTVAAGDGFASPTAQEVAVNPTQAPTSAEPTAIPTEAEPTQIPTETPVPATATDAPPAPVETGSSSDPLLLDAAVCVLMFNDANQNNIRDTEEALIANGIITLRAENSSDEQQYTTTGESEPFCFSGVETGEYVVNATAPTGFGLRRDSLLVNVPAGQQFLVRFAAVEGLEMAAAPTNAPDAEPTPQPIVEEAASGTRNLRNIAGIIVFALAGVVLVGGIGAAIVASRR
jgi:LysM repeat protein